MQFTPQQMMGGKGFHCRTMIGNWSEDLQFQEDKLREWLRKRESGGTAIQQMRSKMSRHKAEAFISPEHSDGHIHFGDSVMLQNAHTEGYLSVDLDDFVGTGYGVNKYIATTGRADKPMLRNTWTIIKVDGDDDEYYEAKGEGNVLHYTQKFKLVLNPSLSDKDSLLLLASEQVSQTSFSKVSHKQEVTAKSKGTFEFTWQAVWPDLDYRMEMEGQPVQANVVLLINHCQTNQPLASDKQKPYVNDFGSEWEVCAHKWPARATKLAAAFGAEQPQNHWALITGPKESDAPQEGQ
eukprot:TRINITY_DN66153_c0_g1_i1.p1 TRINITY_DN66153_c0_g1~~TRINITY_DN66153_c0_g1_i1.p1  ORF type:complete len:317 (+),score=32.91 TRINITY_DN66153_c0_g1_i1:71-952(+)